jgi:hypothetical protein
MTASATTTEACNSTRLIGGFGLGIFSAFPAGLAGSRGSVSMLTMPRSLAASRSSPVVIQ